MSQTFNTFGTIVLYVFRINDEAHEGCVKIGQTTLPVGTPSGNAPGSEPLNAAARERINKYTNTAGIAYELLYTEEATTPPCHDGTRISDTAVHALLRRSGIERKEFGHGITAQEWYIADLATAVKAIAAVKAGRQALAGHEVSERRSPIVLREEQRDAVDLTKRTFRKSRNKRMLWDAKMRFGKTLSALQVVKELELAKTLIVTHRPVVDRGWCDDFGKVFYEDDTPWLYGSKKQQGQDFDTLLRLHKSERRRFVYFASMQDLRDSKCVEGKYDKNDEVFSLTWDLVIIDEAHEGTQTEDGQKVIAALKRQNRGLRELWLSGTPYNLIDSKEFSEQQTFRWDYTQEQRRKLTWDEQHPGEPNPYAALPTMNFYFYDLGRLLPLRDEGLTFFLNEFLRTDGDTFVHEADVRSFLNLLCTPSGNCYPFSNDAYREAFAHTLWRVPGVAAGNALCRMLSEHPVFGNGNFRIVNVCGDGGDDPDKDKEEAKRVRDAIARNARTITVSCGRLTTGVTIPEWTAVFMLYGKFETTAATYMQTAFRAQTAATIAGRQKTDCYVFDFAPDRALTVFYDYVEHAARATGHSEHEITEEMLNFCPVIAYDGSQMKPYDYHKLYDSFRRIKIKRIVERGFADDSLYIPLANPTPDEIKQLVELDGILTVSKTAQENAAQANAQGMDNDPATTPPPPKSAKPKPTDAAGDDAAAEKAAIKKRKEILNALSQRVPLMIYGAEIHDEEQELTVGNFTTLVDDRSWHDFMPRGLTKQIFDDSRHFFVPDLFQAACRRLRDKVRAADREPLSERVAVLADIFATFRNPDKETVLTPWNIVNRHLATTLGGWTFHADDFKTRLHEPRYVEQGDITRQLFMTADNGGSPTARFLEIGAKTGLYSLYLAFSLFRAKAENSGHKHIDAIPLDTQQQMWDDILRRNIFVIANTPMGAAITRRTLTGFRNVTGLHIAATTLTERAKSKKPEVRRQLIAELTTRSFWDNNNDTTMIKFDAVVGNPPYQIQNNGNGNGADPVYHHFIDISQKIADRSTLIHPARFLFNAGKTPKEFNSRMLNNEHFSIVDYMQDSKSVFENDVEIKGGVAITFYDCKQTFEKIGHFSPFEEVYSILSKVKGNGFKPFSDIVGPRELYGLTDTLYKEHPELEGRQSKGHRLSLGANIFSVFPELFSDKKPDNGDYAEIYGRFNNERCFKWIKASYITHPDSFNKFKVFIPKANGTGAIGEALSTPIVVSPMTGHTDTFISVGQFATLSEAEACLKYVKTRFARTLLGVLKVTQDTPKSSWACVPMQDFTSGGDIRWDTGVADIDRQLCRKYSLTEAETAFIESHIRPMT